MPGWVPLGLLSYVPLLLTRPGRIGIDSKQYLFLDPGRMLSRVPYMWNPNVAFGTVPHQNIGFLFPMGPFFWLGDLVRLPMWVTQRLWLGSLLFLAGLGMRLLWRTLGIRGAGAWAGVLVYMLSPYLLGYVHRISVLLLPWAGLPWLLAFTIRSLRSGGWRQPALFALVAFTVGGINATSVILVGLAPVLWLVFAVWVLGEVRPRDGIATAARIGVLTLGVSAWWIVALVIQGRYGLPVLSYSETIDAVNRSNSTIEVLRGLGYWLFYGRDRLEPWILPATAYQTNLPLIVATFTVPGLAFVAGVAARWRERAYFVALIVVGVVIAVAAHPWDDPSPLGKVFQQFATSSTAGLALRSGTRAMPLMVLGFAALLAAGLNALITRLRVVGLVASAAVGVLAVVNLAPLWQGDFIASNLSRPESIPSYWTDAAAHLDSQSHDTRVLEIPGQDLTFYRWGATWEPITPGLIDRPYADRELIPYGGPGSVDLLEALDRRMQEGTFEPDSLAPVARLMAVGDVVLRSDLQYERYRTPRPRVLWSQLDPPPAGLGAPLAFGPATRNTPDPRLPLQDEIELATPPTAPDPPAVADFPVTAPQQIVTAQPAAGALVVAGSGDGLVDAAAAGLLDGASRPVLYAGTFASDPGALKQAIDQGASLLLTDSNRRRALRWRTLRDNAGYTERPGEQPLVEDTSDARLDLFPGASDDSYTVTVVRGATATASGYGNPVTYIPADRPQNALDGDPSTAWRVGAFANVRGERIEVDLPDAVTTDHVTLLQPDGNRFITRARLSFGDGSSTDVILTPDSRTAPGQSVTFTTRTFNRLTIQILDTDPPDRPDPNGLSGVGFAEIGIPGVASEELVRLPTDLLTTAGADSQNHPLTILLSRQRSNPGEVVRADDELRIARLFTLPTERAFAVTGTARLSAHTPEPVLDQLLGQPGADDGGVTANSSDYLGGDRRARAMSAIDGDLSTHWSPGFGNQVGRFVTYQLPEPITFDHLDLAVINDGRHSVPTRLQIEAGDQSRTVDVPAVPDQATPDATVRVNVPFAPLTGSSITVTVGAVREVKTADYYGSAPITSPVGLAELGVDGLRAPELGPDIPPTCHNDLLTVDGQPVPVRVKGSTADALDGKGLALTTCGPGPITIGQGDRVLRTAVGRDAGIDVDQLVLSSPAGGSALPTPAVQPPTVEVLARSRTSLRVRVSGSGTPFWLVLGESRNDGWHASIQGGGSLGSPTLIDGYANGWYVTPASSGPIDITLTWTPQEWVWGALALSLLAVLCCGALIVLDPGGRKSPTASAAVVGAELTSPLVGEPSTPSPPRIVIAAVAVGVGGALVSTPLLGLVLALATALALGRREGRAVLTIGCVGAFALAAAYVVLQQARHQFPADFGWAQNFPRAQVLGWAAVLLLGVDVIVEEIRRRR